MIGQSVLPENFEHDLELSQKILQEEGCSEIFLNFGSAARDKCARNQTSIWQYAAARVSFFA